MIATDPVAAHWAQFFDAFFGFHPVVVVVVVVVVASVVVAVVVVLLHQSIDADDLLFMLLLGNSDKEKREKQFNYVSTRISRPRCVQGARSARLAVSRLLNVYM